jgi:predicted O-linked N-acetylglucosamine transferase (SPINDLY family)
MTNLMLVQWIKDGMALHQAGRLADAEALYAKSLKLDKDCYPALHLMGVLRLQQNRAAEALPYIQRALRVQPNAPDTLLNQGIALERVGRYADALAPLQGLVRSTPNDSRAWSAHGALLFKLQRHQEALASLDRAVSLDPRSADAWMNRGLILAAVGRNEEALDCFDRVLRLRPDYVETRYSRALALKSLGRPLDALADLDRVLLEKPEHLPALVQRADLLESMGQADQALQSYERALSVQPDMVEALVSRAHCLVAGKRDLAAATADLEHAVATQPDFPFVRGDLLHLKMLAADWRDLAAQLEQLAQGVRKGMRVVNPYVYQGLSSSPADLLAAARIYTQYKYPPQSLPQRHSRRPGQIRLGYLCSDFCAQATMHLAAGLFEHHDRSAFEVIGFDNSPEDGSPMRRRVSAAFDKFEPIQVLSDRDAALLIAKHEIDILVNLNGYFGKPRMGVCALRPAPIQVNYLGFPGSLGAEYMDYILADSEVIPQGEEQFYSERVVRLPNSYQINDSRRPRPEPTSRASHGLAEAAFVFCDFNNSYKVTPEIFALWLRLLKSVQPSVLWLLESNSLFAANLRSEAIREGIDPDRLVFAPPMEISAHLSRLALADLFLDTLPYNAHTTASDALWAGVPVITCRGTAFPGRVAASLLRAVGLPELITNSPGEYETLALTLARDGELLRSYRDRLTRDPTRHPLFDTARTTRQIEMAYERMMALWSARQAPESFSVSG